MPDAPADAGHHVTRRRFLLGGTGLLAGVGLAGGAGVITWDELHHAAVERPLPVGAGTLVIVTLYGGNDGLSAVIPYADNAYHDARPDLAYQPSDVHQLGDGLGLNPGMTGLAGLWHDGHLAVVRGVGYPKPDHSHFRSMDIWQTASPAEPVSTGWIGRWLDATGTDPVRAVNIGPTLPTLALGAKTTAAALSLAGIPKSALTDTAIRLSTPDPTDPPVMAIVRASYRAARTADTTFGAVDPAETAGSKAHGSDHTSNGTVATNQLASQLDLVSRCIKAGVPTRVYSASLGGFDTHADERETQQRLLTEVDAALSGFVTSLAGDPHGRGTVVLVYSEFGRRVKANASQGTDHGTAGPVFALGQPVRGGFYGDQPSLTDLDDGDLKATTDFRDIYHELLSKAVGSDPTPAVGRGRKDLGILI